MRYKNVHSVTTVNSWNSPEEPQDWSHCRDDYFRTWTCKVCDKYPMLKGALKNHNGEKHIQD